MAEQNNDPCWIFRLPVHIAVDILAGLSPKDQRSFASTSKTARNLYQNCYSRQKGVRFTICVAACIKKGLWGTPVHFPWWNADLYLDVSGLRTVDCSSMPTFASLSAVFFTAKSTAREPVDVKGLTLPPTVKVFSVGASGCHVRFTPPVCVDLVAAPKLEALLHPPPSVVGWSGHTGLRVLTLAPSSSRAHAALPRNLRKLVCTPADIAPLWAEESPAPVLPHLVGLKVIYTGPFDWVVPEHAVRGIDDLCFANVQGQLTLPPLDHVSALCLAPLVVGGCAGATKFTGSEAQLNNIVRLQLQSLAGLDDIPATSWKRLVDLCIVVDQATPALLRRLLVLLKTATALRSLVVVPVQPCYVTWLCRVFSECELPALVHLRVGKNDLGATAAAALLQSLLSSGTASRLANFDYMAGCTAHDLQRLFDSFLRCGTVFPRIVKAGFCVAGPLNQQDIDQTCACFAALRALVPQCRDVTISLDYCTVVPLDAPHLVLPSHSPLWLDLAPLYYTSVWPQKHRVKLCVRSWGQGHRPVLMIPDRAPRGVRFSVAWVTP